MGISLSTDDLQLLKSHTKSCYPEEACALLVGKGSKVNRVVVAKNIADDPRSFFEIDPTIRISLEKELRDCEDSIIGVFHSHPDGRDHPSERDEEMIIERNFVWVIAATNGSTYFELSAFEPQANKGFKEVSITRKI
jgi:proteasome lid subunit RPN8/RPN11